MDTKTTKPIAKKLLINDINTSNYVQNQEQSSNFLLTVEQETIFRLNVIGIVVQKEAIGSITNIVLDDGTGILLVRLFEQNKSSDMLSVGDTILVIGRIRMYNEEKYLSPEVVKKTNPLWLKIRMIELRPKEFSTKEKILGHREDVLIKQKRDGPTPIQSAPPHREISQKIEENATKIEEEEIVDEEYDNNILPTEKIVKLIQQLDTGNGVLIEEVIEKSPLPETEKLLDKMLKRGDLFHNQPGKVKVL